MYLHHFRTVLIHLLLLIDWVIGNMGCEIKNNLKKYYIYINYKRCFHYNV